MPTMSCDTETALSQSQLSQDNDALTPPVEETDLLCLARNQHTNEPELSAVNVDDAQPTSLDVLPASIAQVDTTLRKKNKQERKHPPHFELNRLKQDVGKNSFLWNGDDLKQSLIKCCELDSYAANQWFCYVCIRSDEEYEETQDDSVHVECSICHRTWHSQCYETEFKTDKVFWEDENLPCLSCRTGEWKCMVCGVFGFENQDVSTQPTVRRAAESVVYKCSEVNCIARYHRHCVERELARPKTCFSLPKSSYIAARARKTNRKVDAKTSITDQLVGDETLTPAIPPQASICLTTCQEGKSTVGEPDVQFIAATSNHLTTPMVTDACEVENLLGSVLATDIPRLDEPATDAVIMKCCDSPPDAAERLSENVVAECCAQPSDGSVEHSNRSSPSHADSGICTTATLSLSSSSTDDDAEAVKQSQQICSKSTCCAVVPSSNDLSAEPSQPPGDAGLIKCVKETVETTTLVQDNVAPSFSFKCGRHECLLCKRLGRSVTVRTDDAATLGTKTLCIGNVGKHGDFNRIALISCLRCFRAVHFHPHCLPPTFMVNGYNYNFMLCEDHIVCDENEEYVEREKTRQAELATEKAKNAKKRRRKPKRMTRAKNKTSMVARKNELKAEHNVCLLCGKPENLEAGTKITACEKCPACVHLGCLPSGQATPADDKWLCSYHDPNEAMPPILLYDVVWCKDGHYPFWPARIVPWEDVPNNLKKRYGKTAGGLYNVYYFQGRNSHAKEFAFMNSGRLLPFEESNCSESFKTICRRGSTPLLRKCYQALEEAIDYFRVLQRVRDAINAKTFQVFSASWEYVTIAWNQPMDNIKYARRNAGIARRRNTLKITEIDDETPALTPATAALTLPDTVESDPAAAKQASGSLRRPRAAAAACNTKLVEFQHEDVGGSKCKCRVTNDFTLDCDPLTCLNACGKFECDDKNCRLASSKIKCANRRLEDLHAPPGCTKRYNMTLRMDNRGSKGKGLVSKKVFQKGDYIIEYVGEVITPAERERREIELFKKYDQPMFYFMALDAKRVLDAQYKGNLSRFANHSCDPNAVISRITWQGDFHIVLQARRDIAVGEEITYNYDWGTKGKNPMACKCGAKSCRGTIGLKPTSNSKKRKRGEENDDDEQPSTKKKNGKKGRKPHKSTDEKQSVVKRRRKSSTAGSKPRKTAIWKIKQEELHASEQQRLLVVDGLQLGSGDDDAMIVVKASEQHDENVADDAEQLFDTIQPVAGDSDDAVESLEIVNFDKKSDADQSSKPIETPAVEQQPASAHTPANPVLEIPEMGDVAEKLVEAAVVECHAGEAAAAAVESVIEELTSVVSEEPDQIVNPVSPSSTEWHLVTPPVTILRSPFSDKKRISDQTSSISTRRMPKFFPLADTTSENHADFMPNTLADAEPLSVDIAVCCEITDIVPCNALCGREEGQAQFESDAAAAGCSEENSVAVMPLSTVQLHALTSAANDEVVVIAEKRINRFEKFNDKVVSSSAEASSNVSECSADVVSVVEKYLQYSTVAQPVAELTICGGDRCSNKIYADVTGKRTTRSAGRLATVPTDAADKSSSNENISAEQSAVLFRAKVNAEPASSLRHSVRFNSVKTETSTKKRSAARDQIEKSRDDGESHASRYRSRFSDAEEEKEAPPAARTRLASKKHLQTQTCLSISVDLVEPGTRQVTLVNPSVRVTPFARTRNNQVPRNAAQSGSRAAPNSDDDAKPNVVTRQAAREKRYGVEKRLK